MNGTLNDLIIKYVDYGSEEYVKTLLSNKRGDRKLGALNPYVGVITYPSSDFLKPDYSYDKTVQFQNTTYVGHMEFLLPPIVALSSTGLSYTLLKFELDGYVRQFVQISSGDSVSQGIKFKDFILGKYPESIKDTNGLPFNRHAFHILTDIEISGASYDSSDGGFPFVETTAGAGAFTPSIQFQFAVSGFKCLLQ